MRVGIYNIKQEDDVFLKYGFRSTKEIGGKNNVDKDNYSFCGEGEVDEHSLDGVFTALNLSRPLWYNGHSLSVSDVVHLVDKDKYFFCEPFGWADVSANFR